jgi:hypothetical protein
MNPFYCLPGFVQGLCNRSLAHLHGIISQKFQIADKNGCFSTPDFYLDFTGMAQLKTALSI